jgi:hypothetical protein
MIRSLLSRAVKRSISAPSIGWIWAFSIALFAGVEFGFLWEFPDPDSWNSFAYFMIFWALLLFFVLWKASRILGLAPSAQLGSIGSWFGWNLVGISLSLTGLFLWVWTQEQAEDTLLETLATSLLTIILVAIMAPFLVHGTGRAINRDGPSIRTILLHWRTNWFYLAIAVIVVAVPLGFAGDALYHFFQTPTGFTPPNIVTIAGTSLLSAADFIISTAIFVVAYELVVEAQPTNVA